ALEQETYGKRWLYCQAGAKVLFTDNVTNFKRVFQTADGPPFCKDGINDHVVDGDTQAINPAQTGTKAAADYALTVPAGQSVTIKLRLADQEATPGSDPLGSAFDAVFAARIQEADEFFADVIPADLSPDAASVMRQALGGMLWTKQYYHYVQREWIQ